MIRNLKLLGLAAMALLAVSALGAAGAQAASFESASENTTITTTPDGTGKTAHQVFDAAGASITCKNVSGEASIVGTTSTSEVESSTISYSECNFVGQTAEVNMNGCNYNFKANGEVDVCPEEQGEITFSVPNPVCDVVVPPQSGKGTIEYHNINENTEITVSPNVSGIEYTATGAGCPETGSFNNGTYTTGNVIFTGEKTGTKEMTPIKWLP